MTRITSILVFIAAMLAQPAMADYSSAAAGGFTRTWGTATGAPADADPNTSAPSAANIHSLPDWVWTKGASRVATAGFLFYITHDGTGGAPSCTVTPWVRDAATARWLSLTAVAGVTSGTGWTNLQVGNADVFYQVASCGATTVADASPLVLYAAPR